MTARVLEHRTAGGLVDRLGLTPFREQALALGLDALAIRNFHFEQRRHHHGTRCETNQRSIAEVQRLACEVAHEVSSRAHYFDFAHDVFHFAHADARIHRDPAAERAGDADAELEACEPTLATKPRERRVRDTGFHP